MLPSAEVIRHQKLISETSSHRSSMVTVPIDLQSMTFYQHSWVALGLRGTIVEL